MLGAHNSSIVTALNRLADKALDVRVQITTMSSDDVTTAVLEKQVDIGVTVLPHAFLELDTLALFEEQMQLYYGAGHPLFDHTRQITKDELLEHKFVESPPPDARP